MPSRRVPETQPVLRLRKDLDGLRQRVLELSRRLAAGATGETGATGATGSIGPSSRFSLAATVSVASTSSHGTQLAFDTTAFNDLGLVVTGGSSWTLQTAGLYDVLVRLAWSPNTSGRRAMLLTLNDVSMPTGTSAFAISGDARQATPIGEAIIALALRRRFNGGDVLRLWCGQNSGGSLDLAPRYGGSELVITRLSS